MSRKKSNWFPWGRAVYVLLALLIAWLAPAEAKSYYRLDANPAQGQPRNFRTMNGEWQREFTGEEPSREGLDTLMASGSGQLTEVTLEWLRGRLEQESQQPIQIYLVDLRQEPHGYANDLAVSLYKENNQANRNKNPLTAEANGQAWLNSLLGKTIEFFPLGKTDPHVFQPVMVSVDRVRSEEQVLAGTTMRYARFATPASSWPEPVVVDAFLDFVRDLPDNAWLHFHCHAGSGRTTTFLIMYDRLRNRDVPLDTIVQRQYLLGGANILTLQPKNSFEERAYSHRTKMLRLFDRYITETSQNQTSLSWSAWLKHQ